MKLSECRIGTIVTEKPEKASGKWHGQEHAKIGYIVGLTMNACDAPEVIPIVQWAYGSNDGQYGGRIDPTDMRVKDANAPVPVHHANLDLYTS